MNNRIVRILIYCGIFLILFTIILFTGGIFSPGEPVGDKLALIEINGTITSSKDVIEEIQRYKDDNSVKAILLRIDSPGGAVAPAQEIHRELNKVQKKIIVSMGSVAASGGYYIACTADRIFANPGTLTGSIGVISQFMRYDSLLGKIGVSVTTIKSGKLKDVGNPFLGMTKEDKIYFQSLMDNVHRQFIAAV